MAQAEGGRLSRHRRPANIVRRRVRQDSVDDADPVEPDHDRQPAGDRGGLVAAYVLQPAHVPLDVQPNGGQRVTVLVDTPAQEDVQVGLGMQPGLAAVAAQVGRRRGKQNKLVSSRDASTGSREGSHTSPCVTGSDERQHISGGRCGRPGGPRQGSVALGTANFLRSRTVSVRALFVRPAEWRLTV